MSKVELHYLKCIEDGFDADLEDAILLLDEEEKSRFESFKHLFGAQQFLQARKITKTILGEKCATASHLIRFSYNSMKKPYLSGSQGWRFSIAHSNQIIVAAIAEVDVGVDTEHISRCQKVLSKAGSFLNAYVKQLVDAEPEGSVKAQLFATHWSCTEAFVKMRGTGMFQEKDRVECKYYGQFSDGKYYRFDNAYMMVFEHFDDLRLAISVEDSLPTVSLHNWRTGEKRLFIPT